MTRCFDNEMQASAKFHNGHAVMTTPLDVRYCRYWYAADVAPVLSALEMPVVRVKAKQHRPSLDFKRVLAGSRHDLPGAIVVSCQLDQLGILSGKGVAMRIY